MQGEPKPVVADAGRVLLVDDDPVKRYVTSRLLRSSGYEVVEAATGEEGLRLASTLPDLVILDVKMPDVDGFEVARRLRAAPATKHLPLLHLSATFVQGEHQARGLDAGSDGYLTYPIEPLVLLAQMRALLRMREAEREREDLLTRERDARERAEKLQERFRFLAEVGQTLASSLEPRVILEKLSERLVPKLSDFCLVALVGEPGGLEVIAGLHVDGSKQEPLRALERAPAPPTAWERR